MARKSTIFVVETEGRDKGGTFTLTELPADEATDLCLRALQVVARGGVDIPPHIFSMGPAGLVTMGVGAILAGLGKTPWFEVKPLLDALLPCVTEYRHRDAQQPVRGWQTIKGQIEEPSTILQLYEEVVSLHLGFSLRERLSYYRQAIPTWINGTTPNTSTSTDPSPSSSEPNSQA